MTALKLVTSSESPDAWLFRAIAQFRDAWLNCEKAWNADNLESGFGAGDSRAATLAPVFKNLEVAKDRLNLLRHNRPETVRGAWAYLELMRDLANHLRLNPESSISDIDYAAHLAKISECLEYHVYSNKTHADAAAAQS